MFWCTVHPFNLTLRSLLVRLNLHSVENLRDCFLLPDVFKTHQACLDCWRIVRSCLFKNRYSRTECRGLEIFLL